MEVAHRLRGTCEQRRVGHPAAGLDQLSRCHSVVIEQRGGREIDETRALVGPVVEHLRHAKRRRTDLERRSELDFQLGDDARIDPDLAAAGYAIRRACRAERRVRDAQATAQRVARGHRIERRQLTHIAAEYRGRKGQYARGSQAAALRLGEVARRDRARGFQTQIGG